MFTQRERIYSPLRNHHPRSQPKIKEISNDTRPERLAKIGKPKDFEPPSLLSHHTPVAHID